MSNTPHFNITLPVAIPDARRLPDIQSIKQGMQEIDLAMKNISDASVTVEQHTSDLASKASNVDLSTGLATKASVGHTHTFNKSDVGLGNADNTSDSDKPISAATQSALNSKVNTSLLGANNGIATLDANGKVPSAQLPSYVDDIIEGDTLGDFPATGESGKIYIALDTNRTYRWSGSSYTVITSGNVDSVNGKTGVVTLTKSDVGLGSVDNTSDIAKPISSAVQTALNSKANLSHGHGVSDIPGLQTTLDNKSNVGHSHSYSDLSGKPTKLSDFTNDLDLSGGGGGNTNSNSFKASIAGTVTPFVGSVRYYPRSDISISNITVWTSIAQTVDLVINIKKNGVSAGTITLSTGEIKKDNAANIVLTSSDYITFDITSGNAEDLVVRFDY